MSNVQSSNGSNGNVFERVVLGNEQLHPGVDPTTRLTVLPDPHAPLIEDCMLTEQMVPNPRLLPVVYTSPVQPTPTIGQRIMHWWHRTNTQGIIAGLEHFTLVVFGALLVALSYFLLEHEAYANGDVVNNGTLYDMIGNHLWVTSVCVVLTTLVASVADLATYYLHNRPQGTHQIILMWRAFNLASFKGFSLLFLGIIALTILTGTSSVIG